MNCLSVPALPIERHDALVVQFLGDTRETPGLSESLEDAPDDLGLERLDLALPGGRVVHVAVAAPTERLRDPPRSRPLQLAARRPLDDLLALDLGGERAQPPG